MKIYFIYAKIPMTVYDTRIKFIISNVHDYRCKDNHMFGLYAWTRKKKLCEEFLELRDCPELYTVIKRDDIREDQYKVIKDRYFQLELKPYRYFYDTKVREEEEENADRFMEVVSTQNEYNISTNEFSEYINEFGPHMDSNYPDYRIFNSEVIKALDIIGYTTDFDIINTEDARKENAINLFQQGKTVYGRDLYLTGENELSNLLFLFRYMFFGTIGKGYNRSEREYN